VLVLCFGSLSAALMQSIVIPIQSALPTLLGTSASNASWVVTATLLGGAVAMPISGRLADVVGKKPVIVATAVLMIVGSVVCALSSNLVVVLAGRVIQGLSMGYIPVAIAMVREVAPARSRNTAVAAVSATLGVGGALGLPLAAWIAQDYSWHAIFWVAAAIAAVDLIVSLVALPHIRDEHPASFDVLGAVGLTVGLVGVLVGISKGGDWGWGEASTLGCIVGGLVVLLVWGWYELRHKAPLVDLRSTARRPVLLTNIGAVMIGFGLMALNIVGPQLLEMPTATGYGLGQTMLAAGLWMAPSGIMMIALTPFSSAMLTRAGGRITLAVGAAVIAAGYVIGLMMMNAPWQLLIASCVVTAGVGIGYAAMPTLIMRHVPVEEIGSGVGVNTLMRSIGTTTAGAVIALILTSNTAPFAPGSPAVPTQGAFQLCFVLGALAAAVGAAVVLLIPREKARSQEPDASPTEDVLVQAAPVAGEDATEREPVLVRG
jgi:MFS family permease